MVEGSWTSTTPHHFWYWEKWRFRVFVSKISGTGTSSILRRIVKNIYSVLRTKRYVVRAQNAWREFVDISFLHGMWKYAYIFDGTPLHVDGTPGMNHAMKTNSPVGRRPSKIDSMVKVFSFKGAGLALYKRVRENERNWWNLGLRYIIVTKWMASWRHRHHFSLLASSIFLFSSCSLSPPPRRADLSSFYFPTGECRGFSDETRGKFSTRILRFSQLSMEIRFSRIRENDTRGCRYAAERRIHAYLRSKSVYNFRNIS